MLNTLGRTNSKEYIIPNVTHHRQDNNRIHLLCCGSLFTSDRTRVTPGSCEAQIL